MKHPDQLNIIPLRIVCLFPPPVEYEGRFTEFGIQDRTLRLHHGQPQKDGSVWFDCTVQVTPHPETHRPHFSGVYVHGASAGRFLSLQWRCREWGRWRQLQQLRLHLGTITWEQIESAKRSNRLLTATIAGIEAPVASLLRRGWQLAQAVA